MLIAGETSGDLLAADLVRALRGRPEMASKPAGIAPVFFGAGGNRMAEAGVDLAFDLTRHSVIGLWEALRQYATFRRLFRQLLDLAVARRPDVIVCVDFSGFNRRFAAAVRAVQKSATQGSWHPRIVQYVSPQVWASRPGRAVKMARDIDLLLAILPFEKDWYARRVPGLRVEFVGHPILDRHLSLPGNADTAAAPGPVPLVVLLPGSRRSELTRHIPVLAGAMEKIQGEFKADFLMVLPDEELAAQAKKLWPATAPSGLTIQIGRLSEALARATLALVSTGTVTLECAVHRLPTVALYKTSWGTYQIGKRLVTVPHLAMPNLLAGEAVFPEFIQQAATPENIGAAALNLLRSPEQRQAIQKKLDTVVAQLGTPGASGRAAEAIFSLLP